MILTSDLILSHHLWEKAVDELVENNEGSPARADESIIFRRLSDLFVLACAIGIKEDKVITDIEDAKLGRERSISRSTYLSQKNTNLQDLLNFMLQNALLKSSTIDFSIEERMKLAFDPEYVVPNFSGANFLIGFANYGLEKIYEHVNSKSPMVVIESLHDYFESLSGVDVEELLKNFTLDEMVRETIEGISE